MYRSNYFHFITIREKGNEMKIMSTEALLLEVTESEDKSHGDNMA